MVLLFKSTMGQKTLNFHSLLKGSFGNHCVGRCERNPCKGRNLRQSSIECGPGPLPTSVSGGTFLHCTHTRTEARMRLPLYEPHHWMRIPEKLWKQKKLKKYLLVVCPPTRYIVQPLLLAKNILNEAVEFKTVRETIQDSVNVVKAGASPGPEATSAQPAMVTQL